MPAPTTLIAIVAAAWLIATASDAAALILAPYDADTECSNATANSRSNSSVVLLDSYSYLSLDRLWFADDESIDLFNFPIPADPEVWELADNTDCRNVWQYCGGSIRDILLTQFVSTGAVAGTEIIVQIDYNFVSESDPSASLSCSSSGEISADDDNVLIAELDDTYVVYSEQIPCGAGRLINASVGHIRRYEFTFTPMDSFEIVLRANLSDINSCVRVSRIRAFHHICPSTTTNYVHYRQTPAGLFSGSCVPNAQPLPGAAQDNGIIDNITAQCSHLGEWIFPHNLTSSDHCLCAPGYFPDDVGIECLPCPNGTYKTTFGREACVPCPSNSYSDQGSSFCQCNVAYTRLDPSDVSTGCETCAVYYFPMDGTCNPCPTPGSVMNGNGILYEECMCLNGTTTLNYTQDSNVTLDNNYTMCAFCAENYYRSPNGNESCLLCPPNSFRDLDLHSENTCYCTQGSLTASGQTQTTLAPCDNCDSAHFVFESGCRPCPEHSSSPGLDDEECRCERNTSTPSGDTTTRGDACVCSDGLYRSQDDGSCVPCPSNSYRSVSSHDDYCPCITGYTRTSKSSTTEPCYGPVIGFDQHTVHVFEGNSTHVVAVTVYSTFPVPETITVNVNVTNTAGSSFSDELTLPVGETHADYQVFIQGDKIALESDFTVQVMLTRSTDNDNYIIGSGDHIGNQSYHNTTTINVREDDIVYVGYTKESISSVLSSGNTLELLVAISTDIGRELAVSVTSNISLSVFSIQRTAVTFVPNGSRHLVVPVQLSPESNSLVDAYYVGVALEIIGEEYLRDEVRIGGMIGFNEQLTLILLPQQETEGLTQGAEIGIISACASALIAVLALLGVLIFCYSRQRYREKYYHHKSDCSSEDDFNGKGMIELRSKDTKSH